MTLALATMSMRRYTSARASHLSRAAPLHRESSEGLAAKQVLPLSRCTVGDKKACLRLAPAMVVPALRRGPPPARRTVDRARLGAGALGVRRKSRGGHWADLGHTHGVVHPASAPSAPACTRMCLCGVAEG